MLLQVLGDGSYLPAALRAGELVWARGLLKKGPGLCHGVSGNAYALMRLYKATQVGLRAVLVACVLTLLSCCLPCLHACIALDEGSRLPL